jgi:FKBP-type peptidyl-prolyl cis-trans isomerase FkpA
MFMRKFPFLALFVLGILLNSCAKNETSGCQPVSVASEKTAMVAFCTANSINYKEDPSGLLYEIILPGADPAPGQNSIVSATYTGKLMNGTVFDQTATPVAFQLSGVIDGWKIGIPLIKKGGRIKMVIPSTLAYSCTGYGTLIPSNSPLYFDVTVTDVK